MSNLGSYSSSDYHLKSESEVDKLTNHIGEKIANQHILWYFYQ